MYTHEYTYVFFPLETCQNLVQSRGERINSPRTEWINRARLRRFLHLSPVSLFDSPSLLMSAYYPSICQIRKKSTVETLPINRRINPAFNIINYPPRMYTRGPGHRGVLLRVYAPRERSWREEGTRGWKREREGRRKAKRGWNSGLWIRSTYLGVDPAWARRRWRKQIKLRNEPRDR